MFKGSTSGLQSLPVLSSQTCGTWRNSALCMTSHFAAPRRISSTFKQNVLQRRNGPRSRDALGVSGTSLHPSRPANGTPCLARPSVFSGMQALPREKIGVEHLVGIDSLSATPGHRQSRVQARCKVLDHTEGKCPARRRRTLLWVMLTAKTPDRAWAAYKELLSHRVVIPHHMLHQLARLLASIKPRTRTVHIQLLSVLETLKRNRGQLRLWEWNTLIDSAGKQWHKTRLEDYENSLDIFNKRGVLPTGNAASADEAVDAEAGSSAIHQNPDIWTYNILLSIASRSNLPLAVRHASSLLLASGLTPNRLTHLCLLRHFASRNDLRSVRSTLRKMTQQGLEVGLDGTNACLWAYARSARFDVALRIYHVLRSNIKSAPRTENYDVNEDSCYIRDTIGLDIPDCIEPNEITYTMMIQSLAYHGDLKKALGVFVDMLSTPHREAGVRATVRYKPSMAAFRALFLGFSRHGREPEHRTARAESVATLLPSSWDQDALETVFTAFLQLPSLPKPTGRVIYWILVAFDKTSGNDTAKLREVWTKLECKFGGGWGGRLEEFRKSIFSSSDGNI